MNRPAIHLVAAPEGETAAARAQRLAAEAAFVGQEAVHELLTALGHALQHAEAVSGLTSIPAGQREVARRAAMVIRADMDTLFALIGRA